MHEKKDILVKIMLSTNVTQHVHIVTMVSQINIILTQRVDHISTTCAKPKIELITLSKAKYHIKNSHFILKTYSHNSSLHA